MNEEIFGTFSTAGSRALVVLSAAHGKPLVLPARSEVEARLETTIAWWKSWTITYDGPWREAVERSALALKLLVHAPSGAVAAAATTSLPEEIGGERNWDYRFSWVRDSAFILSALLQLGRSDEAEAFFWWVMHASQRTHPRLQVLYRLDGGSRATERPIDLAGYQQSRPVRVGNGAADQVQLDIYGDLLQAAWLFAGAGNPIDADIARRLAEIADLVCRIWTEPDAGLWEVRSGPQHFTQSKIMCWIALDRAIRLGERGALPSGHVGQWREQATKIQTFLEERCWSETKRSYVRFAGTEDLDASLLLGVLFGYVPLVEGRLEATVEAIRVELSHGLLVHRYAGEDGLAGQEGAFLACSFWLAEALARVGRHQEALDLMDGLVALANDVGLFAEEIDPTSGAFLGNLPQALTHLGLINAALAVQPNVSK
jgi:GH15 family glucan-1,4-alpha-glucosidase